MSNILKNPLGAVADAVTSPFKAVGNIASGKGNIGDLLNIGGTLFGGNLMNPGAWGKSLANFGTNSFLTNVGIGDPTKWNTSDFLKLGMSSMGGQPQQQGYQMSNLQDLTKGLIPLAQSDIGFALANNARRMRAQQNAADSIDPANDQARYQQLARQLLAMGGEQGDRLAGDLKRSGYGSGTQAGARAGAMNNAQNTANKALFDMNDTSGQRYAELANLFTNMPFLNAAIGGVGQTQGLANAQRSADLQYDLTRPNTTGENAIEYAMQLLPYFLSQQKKPALGAGFTGDFVGPRY